MEAIVNEAIAWGTANADVETGALVVWALAVLRWLWLGIRADVARLRGRKARRTLTRAEHEEAFDRGMRRLLADLETRPEPELTAYRHAA
jgi:hypothetical protein